MISGLMNKIFGSANDRLITKYYPLVNKINALESGLEALSDHDIKQKTQHFKDRLAKGETLDNILVEAFATVREATKRVMGMRLYDVQLIGGMILNQGKITEMKTGEGKTLVATLAVYLNAISGKGVHVVTVNDYLAQRDAEWMGEIYRFLGLTVGSIVSGISEQQRQEAYHSDITYGTNNEFGFDYLRDNMKFEKKALVQRPFNYAIIDEVDSILIDEARTPLIISGPAEDSSELYTTVNKLIPMLKEDDFEKDEKQKSVTFTEKGTERIEELLTEAGMLESNLYDVQNVMIVHHANQALKAHTLFSPDVDYIVKDGKVVLIDEFTGRMMSGRRFSEGLHQALEAKEGVDIEMENQTLASITFQNYFRLYPKIAGMAGTAKTEESEFQDIYKLDVVEVPTNQPVARHDYDDEIYRTAEEKYLAIIKMVKDCQERKQPVLVGTVSIEKSEYIASLLKKEKITHNVLNARYHDQEADIISQAGAPGSVTIATNMAGRGTDIQLGGNLDVLIEKNTGSMKNGVKKDSAIIKIKEEHAAAAATVREAGGLYVVGTERHESRRIDNQLRGRSGRQGDPGTSKFFLSLEDDLMRVYSAGRLGNFIKQGMEEGEAISSRLVSKSIEHAQRKVEARHYDIRKNLLKFDDVMNDQRKVVYKLRHELMDASDTKDMIDDIRFNAVANIVDHCIPAGAYADQWQTDLLHEECMRLFGLDMPIKNWADEEGIADEEIKNRLLARTEDLLEAKEKIYGPEIMRQIEKELMLNILDNTWKEHLHSLDHLRQGIGLRAYGQRNPLNEYKTEAYTMFEQMLNSYHESVITFLCRIELSNDDEEETVSFGRREADESEISYGHKDPLSEKNEQEDGQPKLSRSARRKMQSEERKAGKGKDMSAAGDIRRNAPCPCESGLRYKHCHGKSV